MRYAGVIRNDVAAAPGVCYTFFVQGCDRHCPGCHNPETWDFNGGQEFTIETINKIINGIKANGIQRDFCVMGGEPLADQNLFLTYMVVTAVREEYPDIKIYLWTGYTYEELTEHRHNPRLNDILKTIDVLIDGPFIQEQRDISLWMRGSTNQRVIDLHKKEE